MSYLIDARLENGIPAVTLVDAESGKECLCWRCDAASSESAWQMLFKRLMLLSCVDSLSLVRRAQSSFFGSECLECNGCIESQKCDE